MKGTADRPLPPMPTGGMRLAWEDVPADLRALVENRLGSRVLEAVTQRGGFSPGAAVRLRLADGSRAFAKAVAGSVNPYSPGLYRNEARTAALLPPGTPSPRLRFSHDDGDWVVLVFDDVDGEQPALPWRAGQLAAVTRTLAGMSRVLTPCPVPFAPAVADLLGDDFTLWRRLAGGADADGVDGWALRHLDRLAGLEATWACHAGGDTLTHADLRADNLLLTRDGRVMVVDWAWPCRAAPWFDLVLLLVSVLTHGRFDVDAVLHEHPTSRDVDPAAVDAVLAGLAGFFADHARRPPPSRMPTVRAAQAASGRAALRWLASRRRWD